MKLSQERMESQTIKMRRKMERAKLGSANRNLLYDLRRAYYDGKIYPDVERDHDMIYSQFAATIVDRFAAYAAADGLSIKLKSPDVSNAELTASAEKANGIADMCYNSNDFFQEQIYNLHHTSGLNGDGYLDTVVEDGMPIHKSLDNPQNIYLGFRNDFYTEFDFWIYEAMVSIEEIMDIYGIEVGPFQTTANQPGSQGTGSHSDPYANGNILKQASVDANTYDPGMAKYAVMHDLIAEERTQSFNDKAMFKDKDVRNLYHFRANNDPGRPYGLCDFETVAHLITKYEEKMSEKSDAVAQSVHPKIITDQNTAELQSKWKANRTQAFKVPSAAAGGGRMEVLNLGVNPFNEEQLLTMLLNAIRTNSGLQELGQDTISANVSGRAIAQMYQGVVQKIKSKRLRLQTILNRMVVDDFRIMAESSSTLKKLAFDEQGVFRFQIDVKYPPVLEQDEQIRISNIQVMRQGDKPLMSDYTARTILSDYIDDPMEEDRRISQEQDAVIKRDVQKQADIARMQAEAQQSSAPAPQPAGGAQTAPGAQNQAVAPQGIDPAGAGAPGVVSTPGNPGTAGQTVSAPGLEAQQIQQNNQQ